MFETVMIGDALELEMILNKESLASFRMWSPIYLKYDRRNLQGLKSA